MQVSNQASQPGHRTLDKGARNILPMVLITEGQTFFSFIKDASKVTVGHKEVTVEITACKSNLFAVLCISVTPICSGLLL
jgi:hypothetical protein